MTGHGWRREPECPQKTTERRRGPRWQCGLVLKDNIAPLTPRFVSLSGKVFSEPFCFLLIKINFQEYVQQYFYDFLNLQLHDPVPSYMYNCPSVSWDPEVTRRRIPRTFDKRTDNLQAKRQTKFIFCCTFYGGKHETTSIYPITQTNTPVKLTRLYAL